MRRDVRALHLNIQYMDWLFCSNNSLSPEMVAVGLPPEFKLPKEMFEGKRDSKAHLMQYNNYMNVLGASNAAKCKAFLSNLKGSAKDWYLSLSHGSTQSFSQLGQMFWRRFRAHRVIMSTPMSLKLVKQGDEKSLQDYVK